MRREPLSKAWKVVIAVGVVLLVVVAAGGTRWLWQRLLALHGIH